MITIPGLALLPAPSKKDDSPIDYETRCIVMDATRAAKMGDPVEKACSYARGSWQHQMWINAYATEKLRLSEVRNG